MLIDDRYELQTELGRGGVGAVWLALQHPLMRRVAIKLMRPEYSGLPHLRRRFAREARNASRLAHENIAAIFDFGVEAEGRMYLAMELVEGPSLREFVSHGASMFEILLWSDQLLSALSHAHARGVVHRDLKPENVLMAKTLADELAMPKLVDFGISTNAFDTQDARDTHQDEVVGTPLYMSPEQASGERNLSPRTDLYNLGLILYELISGQHPFNSASGIEAMHDHVFRELPELVPRPGLIVPEGLGPLITKALAKSPSDRWMSAMAMRDALSPWLALSHSQADLRRRPTPALTVAKPVISWATTEPKPHEGEIEQAFDLRLRRLAFVGREHERGRLMHHVDMARHQGRGQVVVLAGEPGIGKTGLAMWLKEQVEERGLMRGHIGVAHQGAGGLRAMREIVESLMRTRTLGRDEVLARIAHRLASWGAPESGDAMALASFLRGDDSQPHSEAAEPRAFSESLYALLTRALSAACTSRPRLLILEDIHDASGALWEFLDHLAVEMRFQELPLLVIATCRPDELARRPELAERLARLARHSGDTVARLDLGPLVREDAEDFVSMLLHCDRDLAELAYARSGGNPLHLVTLARFLHDRDLLIEQDGLWVARDPEAVAEAMPPALVDLFALRLRTLEDREGTEGRLVALLRRMALLGARFRHDVLVAMLRHEGNDELLARHDEAFDILLHEGIITEVMGRGDEFYRFRHTLLRDDLLRDIEASAEAQSLHDAAAQALIAVIDEPRPAEWSEIGEHLEASGDLVGAIEAHWEAGQGARRAFAWRQAAASYGRVLRLSDDLLAVEPKVPESWPSVRDEARFRGAQVDVWRYLQTLAAIGDLLEGTGDYVRAERSYRRVVRVVGKPDASTPQRAIEPLCNAWLGLGHIAWQRGDFEAASWAFERAEHLADLGHLEPRLRCDALLGRARVAWHRGNYAVAASQALDAIKLAREFDIERAEAQAMWILGEVARMRGEVDVAEERYLSSQQLYVEVGDPVGEARNLISRAQLSRYRKNFEAAREGYEQALALYRRLGDRRGAGRSSNGLGEIARFTGDLMAAQHHYERALAVFLGIGAQYDVATVYANLGLLALRQGDTARADELLQAALSVVRQQEDFPYLQAGIEYNLALAKALLGEHEASERLIAHALARSARVPIAELDFAQPLEQLAGIRAADGDIPGARELWERALAIYHELGLREDASRLADVISSLRPR